MAITPICQGVARWSRCRLAGLATSTVRTCQSKSFDYRPFSMINKAKIAFSACRSPCQPVLQNRKKLTEISESGIISQSISAFHTTPRNNILPPLPQKIDGTVNDPVIVPTLSPSHGSYHWTAERGISLALIPITIIPFVAGSARPVLDAILAGLVIFHSHIGFQACIIDYFPRYRIPGVYRALMWVLNTFTALVLYAFYQFETNDVGLTEAVKRIWTA